MRVLITRPEREATTLATALAERGHVPVIAPLFRLEILHPPADFATDLASCQAVLVSSANGARALAEASEQRGKPILAVGDTTASTAEGLGFTSVTSAAGDGQALAELARTRLDPKAGPLLHVSGVDIAQDFSAALAPDGFEVRRVALYEAREEAALPDSARAAIEARALDAAMFFSPRASALFARLVQEAGLSASLSNVTAIAISPAALQPLSALPFRATVAAARPTRQSVLDEIDRLPVAAPLRSEAAAAEGPSIMSDTPSSPDAAAPPVTPVTSRPIEVRRGRGVVGAFIIGLVTSCLVVAGALISLPYWPAEIRALWQGQGAAAAPPAPALDLQQVRQDAAAVANASVEATRRELSARLDDLEKRVRAASAAAAERPASPAGSGPDPAIAELRRKIEALESRPAAPPTPGETATPAAAPSAPSPEHEKELATLRLELATMRNTVQTIDQTIAVQRDQTKLLAEAVDKARGEASARNAGEQKAMGAARASALIGIAARLSAAVESGLPFVTDLALLTPLAQGDAKLDESTAVLQKYAQTGVASRPALVAEFPAVAKAALADDLADDSFGERLLGKVRALVSLRRVGNDVEGDGTEAKLARAEAALEAGDLAKAVALVRTLPPQTARATAGWLSRAEANLTAKQATDQISAQAVTLLGSAR
ncbi:uroporphyrinogen-III synthase [uncultured Reyranella sp.]|uniref:uroporphyrinogen-III synthase n=1 Tax=uncultured Reyranella sp. TaxID=735512 RepID=UPI0025EE6A0C|nr:uroporphyrinogen-III synthase [uncultured Reyranella sp.]